MTTRLLLRVLTVVCLAITAPAQAHDVGPVPPEAAEEALYRAIALDRVIAECAVLRRRTEGQERRCQAARARDRDGFTVTLEACNAGGKLPGFDVEVPHSYACTVTVQSAPNTAPVGGVVIFFQASDEWHALIP